MTLQERIIRDPAICAGEPVIRGTRVLARVIAGHLAHGATIEAILHQFPSLTVEDVRAVVVATASAGERSTSALPLDAAAPGSLAPVQLAADPAPPIAALSYDSEGVDRSLIRWMLRLTPRERLDHLQGMIDLARSARRIPHADR